MAWLSRIFGGSATAEPDVQEVIAAFGSNSEASSDPVRDAAELPCPVDTIDRSLITAIGMTPPGEMQEHLKSGFLLLGSFQELSDEERKAVCSVGRRPRLDVSAFDNNADFKAHAAQMASSFATMTSIQRRVSEEMERRSLRLDAFLEELETIK